MQRDDAADHQMSLLSDGFDTPIAFGFNNQSTLFTLFGRNLRPFSNSLSREERPQLEHR